MIIEEGLVAHLGGAAEVSALVAARIYKQPAPDNVADPYITYTRASTDHQTAMPMSGAASIEHPRFQIDCWSSSFRTARTLANAVRRSLTGFTGFMGTVSVLGVKPLSDLDLYDQETKTHRVSQDFNIWHKE